MPTFRERRLHLVSMDSRLSKGSRLTITKDHALLANDRKVIFVDGGRVIALVSKVAVAQSVRQLYSLNDQQYSQVLQPLEHLLSILFGPLARYRSLHDGEPIVLEVVAEVAKRGFIFGATEEQLARNVLSTGSDRLGCASHAE
jgi:hypothetical protein